MLKYKKIVTVTRKELDKIFRASIEKKYQPDGRYAKILYQKLNATLHEMEDHPRKRITKLYLSEGEAKVYDEIVEELKIKTMDNLYKATDKLCVARDAIREVMQHLAEIGMSYHRLDDIRNKLIDFQTEMYCDIHELEERMEGEKNELTQ